MPEAKAPSFTREQIEWLERTYPDRCPTEDMNDRQVWSAAGAARVVRRIRQLYEMQTQRALESQ